MNDQIIQPALIGKANAMRVGRGQKKHVAPAHAVAAVSNVVGTPSPNDTGYLQVGVPVNLPAEGRAQRHTAYFNQPPALLILNFHMTFRRL